MGYFTVLQLGLLSKEHVWTTKALEARDLEICLFKRGICLHSKVIHLRGLSLSSPKKICLQSWIKMKSFSLSLFLSVCLAGWLSPPPSLKRRMGRCASKPYISLETHNLGDPFLYWNPLHVQVNIWPSFVLPCREQPRGELMQDATLDSAFTVSDKPSVSLTQGSDVFCQYMCVKLWQTHFVGK